MKVLIRLETHAYVEEKLYDEILNPSLPNSIESCGIAGPEIIVPLRKYRNCEFVLNYTESTTLNDVVKAILTNIESLNHGVVVAFIVDELRYWIDDPNALFSLVVENYLDMNKSGTIRVDAFISLNAGTICEEDGIRYYMNSREKGKHNSPHVHICDTSHEHEAVILLSDFTVIGDFPNKLLRKAKKRIEANHRFFLEQWNVLTDGLKVDINKYFGLINY